MDRKHPKARPKDEEEFFERVEVVFFFFKLRLPWNSRENG
jgi:hypothetical protein